MAFMVVDINNNELLLRLGFLIKIGAIVNVKIKLSKFGKD
jgi:hypothetical protein